ncbi:MAG: methyltransferase domain-containing protein [Myxococcota bacterium]
MKLRVLQWLACPQCEQSQFRVEYSKSEHYPEWSAHRKDEESDEALIDVIEGALHCQSCSAIYLIREGVPRLLVNQTDRTQSGHKTTSFDVAAPEWEANFLELAAPLGPNDFLGKTVLDLGCGYGRHAYFASRFGAEVIAVDSHVDAVISAQRNCKHLSNVHVIQADGERLPIRAQSMDRVYCFGVLHHAEHPEQILNSASEVIVPGGTLSLWVYGPRQGMTLMINNALRGMTTSMEHEQLIKFSRGIARGLRVFSHTPYRFFRHMPILKDIVSHLPVHEHHQWPFDVVVADIYDRLRIPVLHWFTGEDIERWYAKHGFSNFHVNRRVRNNESFQSIGVRR